MAADPALIVSLSPQQVACLRLVGELRTSKQIAEILGISSHTVDTHLSNAVRKLGASNRMEAARLLAEGPAGPPERLTGQSPPVAADPEPVVQGPRQHDDVEPAGRQVTLSRWLRLAIIVGGAIALVYAVVLVVVGAEVITRMTGQFGHPEPAGVAAPHGARHGGYEMLHTRQAIARTIATPLLATEQAIDEALAQAGAMATAMANGRTAAKLPAMVGQDVFESLGAAMTALFEARRRIVEAHAGLDRTREYLRMPETSYGDMSPKPPINATHLVAVDRQAA